VNENFEWHCKSLWIWLYFENNFFEFRGDYTLETFLNIFYNLNPSVAVSMCWIWYKVSWIYAARKFLWDFSSNAGRTSKTCSSRETEMRDVDFSKWNSFDLPCVLQGPVTLLLWRTTEFCIGTRGPSTSGTDRSSSGPAGCIDVWGWLSCCVQPPCLLLHP
jgi:hypothetical protein